MSDGSTALRRDMDAIERIDKIRGLEKRFKESPSVDMAQEIISNLETLRGYKGYNYQPNTSAINEDISKYGEYISINSKSTN